MAIRKKIYIHHEGHSLILWFGSIAVVVNVGIALFIQSATLSVSLAFFTSLLFGLVVYFFRIPERELLIDGDKIMSPADGKVVVIEEVLEGEYFKDKRIQVSIFMSPTNVHVNRSPISGVVNYQKYHPGEYLVAWHPKSSEKNERNTVVVKNESGEVLIRQIAGKLARKIRYYVAEGDELSQATEFGFIKFGSRVDLFLPLGTKIDVDLKQKVKGGVTVIGTLADN